MPKSMGCVFWQYNDIWPGMSWSSVDYFGRWKALHYMAQKFYAPLLVSAVENPADNSADIFVTSDLAEATPGKLTWNVTDLNGKSLLHGSMHLNIAGRKSEKIKTLHLQKQIRKESVSEILTWLKLEAHGKIVSENLVMLSLPKELNLPDPGLTANIDQTGDDFLVILQVKKPALWAWLELEDSDAKFSDNFLHVTPDLPRMVSVHPAKPLSREDFSKQLQVRSLYNTYTV